MCQLGVARGCTYHVPKRYFLFLGGDGIGGSMEEFFPFISFVPKDPLYHKILPFTSLH